MLCLLLLAACIWGNLTSFYPLFSWNKNICLISLGQWSCPGTAFLGCPGLWVHPRSLMYIFLQYTANVFTAESLVVEVNFFPSASKQAGEGWEKRNVKSLCRLKLTVSQQSHCCLSYLVKRIHEKCNIRWQLCQRTWHHQFPAAD